MELFVFQENKAFFYSEAQRCQVSVQRKGFSLGEIEAFKAYNKEKGWQEH